MATFYISESEAARDLAGLLDRVRAGSEAIIESDKSDKTAVVLARSVGLPKGRLLSETIAMAEAHSKELGYEPVMDADFAADVRERIANRKPRDTSAWD